MLGTASSFRRSRLHFIPTRSAVVILSTLGFASLACSSSNSSGHSESPGAGAGGTSIGGSAGTLNGGDVGGSNLGGTSAGGTSGGSAGAEGGSAGTGTGGSGGTSTSACGSEVFCADFEDQTLDQAPSGDWSTVVSNGSVTVDGTRSFSGTKSLKVVSNGGGATAYARLTSAFPAAGNAFYGRMLFYLESAPSDAVHWTFIQGGGLVAGQSYHALYRYGGQFPVGDSNQFMANYETPDSYGGNGPSSDCWNHAEGKTIPVGVWACAEWKFDGTSNEMLFWLDGEPIDGLTVSGVGQGCVHQDASFPWTAPSFDALDLGWESYQADAARTIYIDDVAISSEPIGCPTK